MQGADAYARILAAAGREGSRKAKTGALQLFLGEVKSVEPLQIAVGSTIQKKESFYINSQMQKNYKRDAEISWPQGEHVSDGGDGGDDDPLEGDNLILPNTLTLTDEGFKAGDLLVLLTADQQTFYILCKVVKL